MATVQYLGKETLACTRRAFAAGTAAACVVAGLGALPVARAAESATASDAVPADEVVIFHTNDTHGYLQGNGDSVVGVDYVAALKASVPHALLLDAGDATQGAPLASLTQGSAAIDLMNEAGYDAMCLGNHEFDFGIDVLLGHAQAAAFPLLGANVLDAQGAPLMAGAGACGDGCSAVLECGGRRIGVFGLATTATAWSVQPAHVANVVFADEIQTAEQQIAQLAAQEVDAIVCLAHLGDGSVPCRGVDLAELLSPEAASSLTAIIDGHSHTVENTQVNGIAVVQTGCNLGAVGKLTLSFAADGSVTTAEELLDVQTVVGLVEADTAVADGLAQIAAEQQEILSVPVGVNPTTLWAGWIGDGDLAAPTRAVETNFGDLVCDAYRAACTAYLESVGEAADPVVTVVNGGGVRAAVPRGMVVRGDLVTAFPFSNTVVVKRVTPAVFKGMLESGLACCVGQDPATGMLLQEEVSGSFLQVGGCTVVVDPGQVVGQRVVSVTLDGAQEPLDLTDDWTPLVVASNSYVMAGADYAPVGEADLLAEIGGDLETIEAYVDELVAQGDGSLPLLCAQGRIRFAGAGYEAAPWTARVLVVDAQGEPVADAELTVQVDGSDIVETCTDADGFVEVELADGPHGLAVVPRGGLPDAAERVPETYVDNYLGMGLLADDVRAWPQLEVA